MNLMGWYKPASSGWLLMHEIRMFWYEMGRDKHTARGRRGMPWYASLFVLVILAAIHWMAWALLHRLPPLTAEPPALIVIGVGLALWVIFSMMLSMALSRSVSALFERGDLDLLLSSPLSPQAVLTTRLAGIVLGVAFLFWLFLAPFAHIGLVLGQPRWLGIYPAILGLAVLAGSSALLLTLLLVRLIGARRTRTVAHVLSALSGAAVFLGSQYFAQRNRDSGAELGQRLIQLFLNEQSAYGIHSWLWLPARALFGNWQLAVALLLGGAALFYLTVRLSCHYFVSGVLAAAGAPADGSSQQPSVALRGPAAFRSGYFRVILRKEWHLLMRDTKLLAQIGMQLLYLLPMFWVIFKHGISMPGWCAALVYLLVSLSGSLLWLTLCAEDQPELLRGAPLSSSSIRTAKLLAALLPVAVIAAPALGWLIVTQWQTGLLTLAGSSLAVAASALIQLWQAAPASRDQFNRRGQGRWLASLLEAVSGLCWAATVYLFEIRSGYAGLTVAVALLTLLTAWLTQREQN